MTYAELLSRHGTVGPYFVLLRLLAFCRNAGEEGQSGDFAARLRRYKGIDATAARLLGKMTEEVPAGLAEAFSQTLALFREAVPLPYIWGMEDFSDYSFAVGPGVLIPREDSEILLEQGLAFCRSLSYESAGQAEVLELCCGTGCISISLYLKLCAEGASPKIRAGDISELALQYAEQNWAYWLAEERGDRGEESPFYLCQSDLFQNPELQHRYDLILANPPYLSERECLRRSDWKEPILALKAGSDGLAILRRIICQAHRFLKLDGALLLEAAPWQMHELQHLLEKEGYRNVAVYRDISGLERVISGYHGDEGHHDPHGTHGPELLRPAD
ncbi:peptide chain release factor N(5)-glutamine methyltransferase [Candidatus Haliotispira prima]|uniref:peptide chain release factor N(5)-glutamine methyltransferase n=1 Tax=Candidatus Haliotispira prima TaxID=3034016 RepID=A0ABY8MKU9_9SPIO|nr:peptide chain release factor N(5)-glutamine methyltransferase [Candidatus Haliotispira prima]